MNKKDKVKKAKKVSLKKIVAGTLATTVLFDSCVKDYGAYYADSSVQDINQRYKNLGEEYPFTVCIIPITAEEKNYLGFVNYLLVDILKDQKNAVRFTKNPDFYVREAGFKPMVLNLEDDALLKIVVSLADNEIREAVINNDVAHFLRLCKEKQVFTGNGTSIGLSGFTPEMQVAINSMLGGGEFVGNSCLLVEIAVAVVGVVFLAVVYYKVAGKKDVTVMGMTTISPDPAHELALQLWYFNGGNPDQTYVLLSGYEEQQINLVIEALQQNFPEKLAGVNVDNLKQLIALNLRNGLQ